MPAPDYQYLAFGIPSLDRLLGRRDNSSDDPLGVGLRPDAAGQALIDASVCLIGPDGTGKSVFALHLASEHWRVCSEWWHAAGGAGHSVPKIIYASTDLSLSMAQTMWKHFWLDRPFSRRRRIPFEGGGEFGERWRRPHEAPVEPEEKAELERKEIVRLAPYKPSAKELLAEFLEGSAQLGEPGHAGLEKAIAFIDLESDTSGDDWSFLNRLLHALPAPKPGDPLHLLVIDAIEGLETLVGKRDAFGERQDRRARVAQLIRAAAGKCHLVMVVEEPRHDERLPEVFVADVVVRLRTTVDGDYSRRTVEVEKVRGQKHTRGQHDFRMRGQLLGQTDAYTPDYPEVGWRTDPADTRTLDYLSHIIVFPSLHRVARSPGGRRPRPATDGAPGPFTGFGIFHLDIMLGAIPDSSDARRHTGADDRGLPAGSITTIIGREATYKSRLARAFLAMAFRTRYGELNPREREVNLLDALLGQGVAVLLTTADVSEEFIAKKLKRHLIPESYSNRAIAAPPQSVEWGGPSHEDGLKDRLIVRHLEPHHHTAANLMHMIQQLIVEAKRRLAGAQAGWSGPAAQADRRRRLRAAAQYFLKNDGKRNLLERSAGGEGLEAPDPDRPAEDEWNRQVIEKIEEIESFPPVGDHRERFDAKAELEPFRIRFVIDDWALILSTFPEVRGNPKFLPALMHYLHEQGVSALILANHQGNPSEELKDGLDPHFQELRSLSDYCLHTWQVSFFDERRVAITLLPSIQPGVGQQVRELRPSRMSETRSPRRTKPNGDHHPLLLGADEQATYDDEHLTIDPHFELYSGLESGKPNFIPLHVYLYAEREDIPSFNGYLSEVKNLFKQLFGHGDSGTVLLPQYGSKYDTLREFSYLQSETRLDHSLVLQVDEFWAESRAELRRLEVYLNARTVDYDDRPELREDPFALFQLSEAMKRRRRPRTLYYDGPDPEAKERESGQYYGPLKRRDFFDTAGYSLKRVQDRYPVFKVPYTWDFGFLVCDATAWEKYWDRSDYRTQRVRQLTVELYPRLKNARIKRDFVTRGSRSEDENVGSIWDRLIRIAKRNPEDMHVNQMIQFTRKHEERSKYETLPEDPDQKRIFDPKLVAESGRSNRPDETAVPKAMRIRFAPVLIKNQLTPFRLPILSVPLAESMETEEEKKQREALCPPVSWREFLGACCTIARESNGQHAAFDVDMLAIESLSCLVFEVWMSELHQSVKEVAAEKRRLYTDEIFERPDGTKRPVYFRSDAPPAGVANGDPGQGMTAAEFELYGTILDRLGDSDLKNGNRFWPRANRDDWTSNCLAGLLDNKRTDAVDRAIATVFRRALYRALLLLSEVVDIERMSESDLNLRSRTGATNAAATRHWYSTATAAMAAGDCRGKVVAGLPGNFAVRGDWFLAVARGSRSPRLGERAIDILCSKRGNITRLQHGLGLPVRDLRGTEGHPPHLQGRIEYWTSLPYVENDGTRHNIDYRELRALGAKDRPKSPDDARDRSESEQIGRGNFQWFWRSSLENYDTHARTWQRWLCLALRNWKTRWDRPAAPADAGVVDGQDAGRAWTDGFREYDYYRLKEMRPECHEICYVDVEADRYIQFTQMIDGLIETLDRSNNRSPRGT